MKPKNFYNSECETFDPDVLILIDHIAREIETALTLKYELEKENLTCEIITSKFNFNRIPVLYTASWVVTPWLYTDREGRVLHLMRDRFGKPSKILNLHAEQVASENSKNFLIPESSALYCHHLSWSSEFTKILVDAGVESTAILEYGNPKLDIYRKKIDDNLKLKLSEKFNLDINKSWVIIVGNAFHLFNDVEKMRFEENGVDIKIMGEIGKRNTLKLFEIMPEILSQLKNVEVIYRPHPCFASRDLVFMPLLNLVKKYDNFHVLYEGSISSWINAASRVVSFHSTAYLEAISAKKIYGRLFLEPVDNSIDVEDLINWPISLKSKEDILCFIRDEAFAANDYKRRINKLEKKYYIHSDFQVSERIRDFIRNNEVSINYYQPKFMWRFKNLFKFYCKFLANIIFDKSSLLRHWALISSDYRINNLVYMSGVDAFNREKINDYKK